MNELAQPSPGYMKGKTKHWFWGALAALLISTAMHIGYSAMFHRLAAPSSTGVLTAIALAVAALTCSVMFAVLLAYGLCNTVKTYKALFIILACSQAPAAAGGFLGNFSTISLLARELTLVNALRTASGMLSLLVSVAWVACLLVIVFSKPATGLLRAAAALLAGYLLVGIIFDLFILGPLTVTLYRQMGPKASLIQTTIALVRNALNIGLNAFFFAAVSFSKRRVARVAPAAQQPAA